MGTDIYYTKKKRKSKPQSSELVRSADERNNFRKVIVQIFVTICVHLKKLIKYTEPTYHKNNLPE